MTADVVPLQDGDEGVAVESCEFWSAFCDSQLESDVLRPFLPRILPVSTALKWHLGPCGVASGLMSIYTSVLRTCPCWSACCTIAITQDQSACPAYHLHHSSAGAAQEHGV